jgi:hypothetical protein
MPPLSAAAARPRALARSVSYAMPISSSAWVLVLLLGVVLNAPGSVVGLLQHAGEAGSASGTARLPP